MVKNLEFDTVKRLLFPIPPKYGQKKIIEEIELIYEKLFTIKASLS